MWQLVRCSFLLILAALLLSYALSKRSGCFSKDFIFADSSFEEGASPPSDPIKFVLSQPFYFLGSGNQAYAFLSQDKSTVLKVFKFHCIEGKKVERLKNALYLTKATGRNSSGVIYVHFPTTEYFPAPLQVQDRAGRKHFLPLDEVVFVLQEKAETLQSVLTQDFSNGDISGAKEKLVLLFEMFDEDLKTGLYDQDHNVIANTGFVKNRPMRIDFGKITFQPEMEKKEKRMMELKKIADERILPWIQRYFPQYSNEIKILLDEIRENLYS